MNSTYNFFNENFISVFSFENDFFSTYNSVYLIFLKKIENWENITLIKNSIFYKKYTNQYFIFSTRHNIIYHYYINCRNGYFLKKNDVLSINFWNLENTINILGDLNTPKLKNQEWLNSKKNIFRRSSSIFDSNKYILNSNFNEISVLYENKKKDVIKTSFIIFFTSCISTLLLINY